VPRFRKPIRIQQQQNRWFCYLAHLPAFRGHGISKYVGSIGLNVRRPPICTDNPSHGTFALVGFGYGDVQLAREDDANSIGPIEMLSISDELQYFSFGLCTPLFREEFKSVAERQNVRTL
jgi:hypothetical protein